jgi:hypothetical protein
MRRLRYQQIRRSLAPLARFDRAPSRARRSIAG